MHCKMLEEDMPGQDYPEEQENEYPPWENPLPLLAASRDGQADEVRRLIRDGADVFSLVDEVSLKAVSVASVDVEMSEWLLRHGSHLPSYVPWRPTPQRQ